MVASFVIWSWTERPDVLISDTGTLVGVMTPQRRALSKERGAGFAARNWLENDGDGEDQATAAARWPADSGVIHLSGKRAAAAFGGCTAGQLVVSSVLLEQDRHRCMVHDPESLRYTGAVSYRQSPDGWVILQTSRSVAGERLWTQWPEQKPPRVFAKTAQRVEK